MYVVAERLASSVKHQSLFRGPLSVLLVTTSAYRALNSTLVLAFSSSRTSLFLSVMDRWTFSNPLDPSLYSTCMAKLEPGCHRVDPPFTSGGEDILRTNTPTIEKILGKYLPHQEESSTLGSEYPKCSCSYKIRELASQSKSSHSVIKIQVVIIT